jgi:RNA polymerase sigma-70 factor (ECF subfamily)
MSQQVPDTDELLRRLTCGDHEAEQQLLARHRDRLKQMVRVRIDPRLAARIDPSDVVQEALTVAAQRLGDYLHHRAVPFYPWLRRIAWEQLLYLHEKHVQARKRTVAREHVSSQRLSDGSVMQLAERFVAGGTSPSRQVLRAEVRDQVRSALDRLAASDREVLVLWYLEELSAEEIAAVVGISQAGVRSRHRRALERLAPLLRSALGGSKT